MKRLCLLGLCFFALLSCSKEAHWNQREYNRILKSINAPVFPNDTINILERGAVVDDVEYLNDTIINNAISELSSRGGGVVKIPAGLYYTAGIVLKDNVNLHLCEGSTLRFSNRYEDYLPVVWTRWEGYDCYNYRPLIYGESVKNVALTGRGVIDGNASKEKWWWMNGTARMGHKEGMPCARTHGRKKLFQQAADGVDYHDRVMGDGAYLRPQLLNIMRGENILIEGLTFTNSPFWVIHPVFCTNLTVRGVTVDSHGANNDGCNPDSCKGVLIEDCRFITGDDCIAIKSGRNQDGRAWGIPTEDVIIRNCLMEDGHGAITMGSEISGGVKNVYAENCTINSPDMYNAVRIKTNTCRGGVTENIHVRNIVVKKCKISAIIIDLIYSTGEMSGVRGFYPYVKNVSIDNMKVESCETFVTIDGLEDKQCVENVVISNCEVSGINVREKLTGLIKDYKLYNINYLNNK